MIAAIEQEWEIWSSLGCSAMASAHRKVRFGSEQAYLRAVEREEQAEVEGANSCGASSAKAISSERQSSEPALPVENTSEMFRQHSHQQSMEGG